MAEYIERAELFRFADEIEKEYIGRHTKPVLNMNSLRYLAKQLPAADVAPVVHGRWVYDEHEMEYSCSVCLHEAPVGMTTYYTTNYCPNCGARMDGDI